MRTVALRVKVVIVINDLEDREIRPMVYVPWELCGTLLLDLCLLQFGLTDAVALSAWTPGASTLIVVSGPEIQDQGSDQLDRKALAVFLSPPTLEALIQAIFEQYERGVDPEEPELVCTVPVMEDSAVEVVKLEVILHPDYEARRVSPAAFGGEERKILMLLHQINNPVLAASLRTLEGMLKSLGRDDDEFDDYVTDIELAAFELEHVPVLIDLLQRRFGREADAGGPDRQ